MIITRRGPPVAKFVRVTPEPKIERSAVIKEIRAFAKTIKLQRRIGLRELRRMTAEGRD